MNFYNNKKTLKKKQKQKTVKLVQHCDQYLRKLEFKRESYFQNYKGQIGTRHATEIKNMNTQFFIIRIT